MTKKSNLWIVGILALVVGYFLGDFIGIPEVNNEMLSGDIAKADLYKGQKVDPETAAIVEKLQSDTAFCNITSQALMGLKERVDGAQALAERTASMCGDVPELQGVMGKMESLLAKAYNAAISLDKANTELTKISNGEKSDLYEQASNNAYICYSKAEGQINAGKDVFTAINAYLKDKKGPEVTEMAQLAADWSKYCIQDAVINGSEEDLAFWSENLKSANDVISGCLAKMEKDLGTKLIDAQGNVASLTALFKDSQKFKEVFLSNTDLLNSTVKNPSSNGIVSLTAQNINNGETLGKFVKKGPNPVGINNDFEQLNAVRRLDPVMQSSIPFPTMQRVK